MFSMFEDVAHLVIDVDRLEPNQVVQRILGPRSRPTRRARMKPQVGRVKRLRRGCRHDVASASDPAGRSARPPADARGAPRFRPMAGTWDDVGPSVLPLLKRVRHPFPPEAAPMHLHVPPGIWTGFGIDIGPAWAHVSPGLFGAGGSTRPPCSARRSRTSGAAPSRSRHRSSARRWSTRR